MDNQEPQKEPQPVPAEASEVAEPIAKSESAPEPVKLEHKFFEIEDEASLEEFHKEVKEFCSKLDFQSLCSEAAMVSGANRSYVALQAALEVIRTNSDSESKSLHQLPTHYSNSLRTCVSIYANARDDLLKMRENAVVHPIASMVVYSEGETNLYDIEEYITAMKDELLKRRDDYVAKNGNRWRKFTIDVIVPGIKDRFLRIVLDDLRSNRPFEVMRFDRPSYPMYTTKEQLKWVEEFVEAHKAKLEAESPLPVIPPDAPPYDPDEFEWKNNNHRSDDYMYKGKYTFKSGVIKLRVVSELEAHEYCELEKWREEYDKFLEGIAHKFDMRVLDNICDEEFVIPPNVLRRDDLQRYLSVPTYKHLPGAKLVFLIHGVGGTIIIYNREKMLTGTCDVQNRGIIRVASQQGEVVV